MCSLNSIIIAGSYEAALQMSPTLDNGNDFVLRETQKCWSAVQECWSDGVFIEALAHKFWKLTLQMLSRYATWATAYSTQVIFVLYLQDFFLGIGKGANNCWNRG